MSARQNYPINIYMKQHIAYKFRLYPNQTQEQQLLQWAGCNRFVWNYMLAENKRSYDESKKFVFLKEQGQLLTKLKQQHDWLCAPPIHALQKTAANLDAAIKRVWKSGSGFPKFKSKHTTNPSIYLPKQDWKIEGNRLKLPKKLNIKFKRHREMRGVAKSLSIVKDIDRWFVVFSCEAVQTPEKPLKNVIGLDLGLKTFVTTSDGETISYEKPVKLKKQIIRVQKELSRKQKGSNNRASAKIKLAKLHRKQADKRRDFHYKLASSITKAADVVVVENLNVKGMVKNRKLSRAISEQGWSSFTVILKNKLEATGGRIVKIGRYFPSSKQCCSCGWINSELTLADREWVCYNCNTNHDRDVNAAVNIRDEGLRILRQELPDFKPVERSTADLSFGPDQVGSMKQEARVALATG